jgi:hypothetical protein
MLKVVTMPRPKRKTDAVTVGKAKDPADRVKVQLVMPYGVYLDLKAEAFRRGAKEPEGAPAVSDVVVDLVRAGLKGGRR